VKLRSAFLHPLRTPFTLLFDSVNESSCFAGKEKQNIQKTGVLGNKVEFLERNPIDVTLFVGKRALHAKDRRSESGSAQFVSVLLVETIHRLGPICFKFLSIGKRSNISSKQSFSREKSFLVGNGESQK